jgi:hypothetical protein
MLGAAQLRPIKNLWNDRKRDKFNINQVVVIIR